MIVIHTVKLPDGTVYVAVREGLQVRLYEQDRETGDYLPVSAPVFGSWSRNTESDGTKG